MKQMLMAAAAALLMAGCTSFHVERDTQLAPTMSDETSSPYYIDYEIKNERVKGTGKSSCWFWFFDFSDGKFAPVPTMDFSWCVHAAKASATYNALEEAKADALMGALYRYTVDNYFIYQRFECEATGYPANIKGVNMVQDRPLIVPKDSQVIRLKPWDRPFVSPGDVHLVDMKPHESLDRRRGRLGVPPPAGRPSWWRWFFLGPLWD